MASRAIGIWSQELTPGKTHVLEVDVDVRIALATLGDVVANDKRTSVKLHRSPPIADSDDEDDDGEEDLEGEKRTTVIANLTPGKIESQQINLFISEYERVEFEVVGENTVYLTGNYIGESPGFLTDDIETKFITTQVYPGGDGSGFDSDEEEGAYMLDEVSSDVEVDPSEFLGMESESDEEGGGRIEEVDEDEGPASKKRSADQMDEDPKPAAGGVSKTQQRKLNKKLKAEGGNAVPAGNAPAGEKKQGEKKPQSSGAQKEGKPKSGGDGKPKHEQSNGANGSGNQQKKDKKHKKKQGGGGQEKA